MPSYSPLALNKHRNIGELDYDQVDQNWDDLEGRVNQIGGDLGSQFPNDNLTATTDPTVNDDSSAGYSNFSRWYNTSTQTLWALTDATVGAAQWVDTGPGYLWLGSASVANVGNGPSELPTNAMLGSAAYKSALSGAGDVPVTDSEVTWTDRHIFSGTSTNTVGTSGDAGFTLFTQLGAGDSGISFLCDEWYANLGITATGELRYGGGTHGAVSYNVYHSGYSASVAELLAGTVVKPVTASTVYPANAPVTSSGAGAYAPDFAAGRTFARTITGNSTLEDPSNVTAGQSGLIILNIDGTGGYTVTVAGTNYKMIGGTPSITTTANAKNIFSYYVESTSSILLSYLGVAA